MSFLKRIVKAITGSKKAVVALSTFIFGMTAPIARRYGVEISPDDVQLAVIVGSAYIVGQGVADAGKSAEQLRQRVAEEATHAAIHATK